MYELFTEHTLMLFTLENKIQSGKTYSDTCFDFILYFNDFIAIYIPLYFINILRLKYGFLKWELSFASYFFNFPINHIY